MNKKQKKAAVSGSWACTNSVVSAALTINLIHQKSLDVPTLVDEIKGGASKIKKGDFIDMESMLWSQAQTLNAFFHRCLSLSSNCEIVSQIQILSDLAVRAQNNCRKTLATIADIKNPKRATFIKQQNNAVNQQVNNNSENLKNSANEVLSEVKHESLDDRSQEKAIAINSMLEAVEAIDRG